MNSMISGCGKIRVLNIKGQAYGKGNCLGHRQVESNFMRLRIYIIPESVK